MKTRTDDDGAYVLSGFVSTSIAHVTASAEGRQSLTREVWVRGTDITGIDFDLNSEASIAGEVMDETGKALIGALVLMDFITPAEDWLEHHPRGFVAPGGAEARADDDGHFDTRGLTAGEYAFRVALAGRDKWVSVASTTPPVKVGAGQRLTDIVVVVPDIGKNFVAGRVVDPKGVPVPGVEVCAGNFHDRPYDRTDTDELGRYRLAGLGEGPVLVWFRHETLTRGANLYLVDVPIGTGDADIVIGHEPGSVAGIVVDAKTRVPLEGAEVEIAALQPDGASHFTRHPYPFEVTVQKGPGPGQFVLDNVVPGLVTLRGKAPGYTPDESVQAVVASGRTTTVTIPVETWSLLEGCVTCNGRPDARVTAVHTQSVEPRRGYIPASVDEQGHYLREELLPGTYDVWIRVPTAAGDEVEFRKTVEVVPGQVFQVDFHIPPS
ncbi:MAG: carboxypeptidase regulatory-like domain-containing protein [bacterium]|nr:carboxypeptidase regulatory-like domain-containing protein [bacterium]